MSSDLPDPASAPELFDGVLTRRVIAYFIDISLIIALVIGMSIVSLISGFFSAGLSWPG